MLTDAEKAVMDETGNVPTSRLRALRHALNRSALTAATAAAKLPKDSQQAAALRGKKIAYLEAAAMVNQILNGKGIHRPKQIR